MPIVDRNLARIAIYEIWWTDTPAEVAVDEAVTLTAMLSTDESPDFVNGLLGKALQYHRADQIDVSQVFTDTVPIVQPEIDATN